MVRTIIKKARAMILDSQTPHKLWGEVVNMVVYLHQCMPNDGLMKRDDCDSYKAPCETSYEILNSYGKPEYDKSTDDPT
jgi:hypothetical protein